MPVNCDKRFQDKKCCIKTEQAIETIQNLKTVEYYPSNSIIKNPNVKIYKNKCYIYTFDI